MNQWLNEVKSKSNPDIKIFLVGNKVDLENQRKVTKEELEEFCRNNNIDFFLEASAKSGLNVRDLFVEAAKCLYLEHLKTKEKVSRTNSVVRKYNLPSPVSLDKMKTDDSVHVKKSCC